ncbi:hypothetical protein KDW_16760 [Dictyobacter vulcani]|uniref:Uncharacterized protein n=1 Tax=Dictyobacter vulcani TaxID=2607529 RepID=A0A5J4KE79_9CHLR|nr:hypothetical protein KDW_16760 [Dictyobacter vulcani]
MVVDIVNPYAVAVAQFDEAADRLGLSQSMRNILRAPNANSSSIFPFAWIMGMCACIPGIEFNTTSTAALPRAVFASVLKSHWMRCGLWRCG